MALQGKPSLLKHRRRVNAITMLGHFATWVTKVAVMGAAVLANFFATQSNITMAYWISFYLVPTFNLVVYPFVQTLSSDPLRKEMVKVLKCQEGGFVSGGCEISVRFTFRPPGSGGEKAKSEEVTPCVQCHM